MYLMYVKIYQIFGANVVDESVVVDKNIVTSRTPDDLDDFNREIVKQLQA